MTPRAGMGKRESIGTVSESNSQIKLIKAKSSLSEIQINFQKRQQTKKSKNKQQKIMKNMDKIDK